MVGLVVVSHSRALARAAVALAAEMVPDSPVRMEVAAGLDESTFGTDAVAVQAAIEAADDGDGVVVLMDLGSAVMSAEMAVEMLEPPMGERVLICPAPLVEGLVAAAVTAAGGARRAGVAAEAMAALSAKQSDLAEPAADSEPAAPSEPAERLSGASEPSVLSAPAGPRQPAGFGAVVAVGGEHGLHARPAARLVAEAQRLDPAMLIRNRSTGSGWVSAASLSRVATLGVLQGHEIELRGQRAAVEAVAALVEREAAPAPEMVAERESGPAGPVPGSPVSSLVSSPSPASPGAVSPVPGSPGIAFGPVRIVRSGISDISDIWAGQADLSGSGGIDAAAERGRLEAGVVQARRELEGLPDREGVFAAHLSLLSDPELLGDADARISGGASAVQAWAAATGRVAADFHRLDDPYLRERAEDVRAVGNQVLRAILGVRGDFGEGDGGILVAPDLSPAEVVTLGRVDGILLAGGSPVSHAAILIRARGIPAVVGAGKAVLDIAPGTTVAIDGSTAEVVVDPPADVLNGFRERAGAAEARAEAARRRALEPAVTRGGVAIAVGANIGSLGDARAAFGADHAGLVRTEFLFLDRDEAPGVEEQVAAYREIAEALGGKPITLRTLDVGGDKPLRYLPAPKEENPFLGVRGIRHSLAHPDLLRTQLAAIAAVARETPVSVMFPMVSTVGEVRAARRILDEFGSLRVGIMVEVPAAALKAADFRPYVDFVSIGTNDLIQYTMAAERGNPNLAGLARGLDPAVRKLIGLVCDAIPEVAVCGELAADENAIAALIASGVRELSVAPPAIPAVKEAVRDTA